MMPDSEATNQNSVPLTSQNQTNNETGSEVTSPTNLHLENQDIACARRKPGKFSYMAFDKKSQRDIPLQPYTWRGKLRNFLHSKPCHIAVIILTLVDVVLVMVEIILDLKNAEKCEGEHAKESVGAEVVHYMSISILSIFLVEIGLKLIADWKHFWAHKMEIFDAVVVVIAFACDVAISFIGTEALAAVGLLIMLRLWRVVRVINGVILTVKTEGDDRVHALKDEIKEIEAKMERREQKIKWLRGVLSENGIEVEEEPEPETENDITKEHVMLESTDGVDA